MYLSSPHYSLEIFMYLGLWMMIVCSIKPTEVHLAWSGLLLTTIINLTISAIQSHNWYLNRFGEEYRRLQRYVLIPYVF